MGGKRHEMVRRLSKPQTNNNSSSRLLSSPGQPPGTSSPFASDVDYFGDLSRVTTQRDRRRRRKSRSRLRAYLYGSSESSQGLSSDEDESPIARNRFSRSGSALLLLSSAKASTSHLSSSSRSHLPLASEPDEDAIVAERIKQRAHTDSLAASNHVSSPLDENKHVDSVFAPVRRKSLYTPGLATRNVDDILRKPPLPGRPQKALSEADRNYYYNPCHPESSPLGRLAALRASEDGRSTPSSLDISHLGGLQLGTLRVTNGLACHPPDAREISPPSLPSAPSFESRKESLITQSGDEDLTPRSQPRFCSGTVKGRSIAQDMISSPEEEHWKQQVASARRGSEVGFKPPVCASTMADAYMAELNRSPFLRPQPNQNAQAREEWTDDEGLVMPDADWGQSAGAGIAMPGSQEEALGRLNGHSPHDPDIERHSISDSFTSYHSAAKNSTAKIDSGYSSNASFQPCESPSPEGEADYMARNHFRKPESDSGRENQVSRVTIDMGFQPFQMARPATENGQGAESPQTYSTNCPVSVKASRGLKRLSAPNSVRKLQKLRPKSQPALSALNIGTHLNHQLEISVPRVPSLMAARHAERLRHFPPLKHTYPTSQHVSSRDSAPSLDERLAPVRFPSPAQTPEDSSPPSMEAGLPDSAWGLKTAAPIYGGNERLTRDIARSPNWPAFGRNKNEKEQRRLVKRAEQERRRAERENKKLRKVSEKHIKKDEQNIRSSRSRTSSATRRNSHDRWLNHNEGFGTITDFGTVATSLGGSPYDIATLHSNTDGKTDGCHLHQMDRSLQRPRSFGATCKTSELESKYADDPFGTHSNLGPDAFQDTGETGCRGFRAQPIYSNMAPIAAWSANEGAADGSRLSRSGQNRRHSHYDSPPKDQESLRTSFFNDRGGTPGKMLRPRSMFQDAPPMPPLPLQHEQERTPKAYEGSQWPDRGAQHLWDHPGGYLSHSPSKTRQLKLAIPDLWSSGSLEKKSRGQSEPHLPSSEPVRIASNQPLEDHDKWEDQRQAWSLRRRSAGEALTNKHRINNTSADPASEEIRVNHSESKVVSPSHAVPSGQSLNCSGDSDATRPKASHSIARKRVGSGIASTEPTCTITRLMGRYDGGLQYGFEPGYGLGGSAGTRSAQTEASRKSVHVSRGYGLDLSDLPVFVAAAPR